jgi:hypothetical protein
MRTSPHEIDKTTDTVVVKLQKQAPNARLAATLAIRLPTRRSRTR